jgi:hypothetical protein
MRNITISVDDELYDRVLVRAAEHRTTVSALIREFLELAAGEEGAFSRLQRQQNELIARIRAEHPGFSAGDRLSRGGAHERHHGGVRVENPFV